MALEAGYVHGGYWTSILKELPRYQRGLIEREPTPRGLWDTCNRIDYNLGSFEALIYLPRPAGEERADETLLK